MVRGMIRMKRLFLLTLAVLLIPSAVWGVGTVTVSNQQQNAHDTSYTVTFTWIADSSGDADATAYFPYGAYITRVVTDPGTAPPSPNYDITLTDVDSYDVMGGTLADRHTSTTQQVVPTVHSDGTNTIFGAVHVQGAIKINISSAGAAGDGTVRLYVISAD
jgi:hypothetical protein